VNSVAEGDKSQKPKSDSKAKEAKDTKSEEGDYEVEKVLDYSWCNKTVRQRGRLINLTTVYKGQILRVCVYVRYRTHLNVVGMGSKLLGVLGKILRWSFTGQILKNNLF
jgi:hypothetical protein